MSSVIMYVPGWRAGFIDFAFQSSISSLILCLEDGTPDDRKVEARYLVAEVLGSFDRSGKTISVRINGLDTPHWVEDLESVVPARPDRIRLPKLRGPEDFARVIAEAERIGGEEARSIGYEVMVENLELLDRLEETAEKYSQIVVFTVGGEDLSADMQARGVYSPEELRRVKREIAARAARVGRQCLDTTHPERFDLEAFRAACLESRAMGMSGRSIISPSQYKTAVEAFAAC
ncbi:HpcH/HpaI aldolase/citrate lyase family protein [Xanthomonas oryzae pv. oryzicola]|uniref:Putative citrate lyase beta chain n=1 Tax=Xanthomonas oryzae pv. oryzicola (strain BLS256) TaxID=383407 RepID=G7TCN1_XANOB|nr:aldolase/citrate lyase family protein [Xanthomonas oryzae]AEQ96209.1 putative citrate lyase beta chain [Xanthomonas oryzae pv. oryzicola BLS256]AJQ87338.1 hypothetical protein BE73_09735 [Xanthomonas oryzae pv. oryzicola]AKK63818.1 hypothetical protein FE36_08170 [Xanthomonas oryzae pv. oryzicola]AKN93629.1 hypothetical protein ACU13_11890 [Xanthomonas oryzae pv. oryzicola]AKN97360.1 hypothetical protein ACU10_11835 [Xanthomonas oryzae pv. oryzicola]